MKIATGTILAILLVCLCTFIVSRAAGDDGAATTEPTTLPAKTGAFDITFTQHSPLSEYSKLLERTGASKEELGPDYDLAQEPFIAYVPSDYDGSKPIGLLVQIFPDGKLDVDDEIHSVLDAHHVMMLGTTVHHLPFGTVEGLCMDAVENSRKMYNIDPSRIYLLGLNEDIEPVGLTTGDLFSGDVYVWFCAYYRQISTQPPQVQYKPPSALLRQAEQHMQVRAFLDQPGQGWLYKAVVRAMNDDGFERITVAPVPRAFLEPAWFDKMLKVLESVKPARPTTAASVDEPSQLLRVAQAYINGGLPDRARQTESADTEISQRFLRGQSKGTARQAQQPIAGFNPLPAG